MELKPVISVIMPCYNASAYLREAIESVQNQTYEDWELLIVDDGSTDNSCGIAREYVKQDKRVRLIEQPNSGACRARNNGIDNARGEFIKFLDADDVLAKECLATQVKQIAILTERQIPFGDYNNIDKDGNILSTYIFNHQKELAIDPVRFFFYEWRILITAPLHRTALLREIHGFDESLKRGQESNLHLRLALADVEFVYRPCMAFSYRDHNAASRISEKLKEGTKGRHQFWIQRAQKCERLLADKYGEVPVSYHCYFADSWFSYARELFVDGNKEEGMIYINKAKKYGLRKGFQQLYCKVGDMFGYMGLEKLLQVRLKLVGKK